MQETVSRSINTADSDHAYLSQVLVVEDSIPERTRLSIILKKLGNHVLEAGNGLEALEILRKNRVQIVLSDWRMPLMSGLELCRIVRQEGLNDPYFILVTGRDTTTDLIAGMDSGADDFIAKPFNSEELRVRLVAGQRTMKMRYALERKNRDLQLYIRREQHAAEQAKNDLKMASQMLTELLPDNTQPDESIQMRGVFKPAAIIGGDFYNYFRLNEKYVGFYIFDVSGHGVPSALMAFMLALMLSPDSRFDNLFSQGRRVRSPSSIISFVNQRIVDTLSTGIYCTMIYGMLDVNTGDGQLCQAGHPHPLSISEDGSIEELGAGGFPVGMLQEAEYEDVHFHLAKGARLVFYSDGITEITNDEREEYGVARLKSLCQLQQGETLQGMIETIYDAVIKWQSGKEQSDDMTFFVIERGK